MESPSSDKRTPGRWVRDFGQGLYEDAVEWCGENDKMASWRVVVLVYVAYAGIRHLFASPPESYSDWFKGITLAFHELGHILFIPLGQTMMILGGSITQLVVPVLAGAYLLLRQRDYFGVVFANAWLAFSLWDLAVYVGDAAAENLPLVSLGSGEPHHDWSTLLTQWHVLNSCDAFATALRVIAFLVWLLSLAVGGLLCAAIIRANRVDPLV